MLPYAIVESVIGKVLVASTSKGILWVDVDDSERNLEKRLRSRFPFQRWSYEPLELRTVLGRLLYYLEGRPLNLECAIDIEGTPFQQKVWDAIRKIPYGETLSYSDLAEKIGQPSAQRAVAQACGANPVPLFIPCHRVVGKHNTLGGYGLGTARKTQLLALEKISQQIDLTPTFQTAA